MEILGPVTEKPRMDVIVYKVAKAYDIDARDIIEKRRFKSIMPARFEAIYHCYDGGWSMTEIGQFFNRDHTTILNAIRRHKIRLGLLDEGIIVKGKAMQHPRSDWPGDAMDKFVSIKSEAALAKLMGVTTVERKKKYSYEPKPRPKSARYAAAEAKRQGILDALRDFGPMSQTEIAKASGVSADTVGYSLSVLRQHGKIEKVEADRRCFNKWRAVE